MALNGHAGGAGANSAVEALVLHGAKDLRFESRPVPLPSAGEVQISIQATGLCGSDLHYYNHGRNGNFVLQHPLVLGHESSGIVTAIPAPTSSTTSTATAQETNDSSSPTNSQVDSSDLKVGDRVALEVGIPCRSCTLCTSGRYNLCPLLRFRSSAKTYPHLDGTLQTRITHLASLCHKLPDNVTYAQGALVEPLAVSLHAINRSVSAGSNSSTPLPGSSALVIGAGAVGILTAVALSVSGVSNITICDIDESRLSIATSLSNSRFGLRSVLLHPPVPVASKSTANTPDHVPKPEDHISSSAQSTAASLITASHLRFGSLGFDRVFECTGIPVSVQTAIHAASPGGKVILVGMGNPVQSLPLGAAALREVDIIGVFRYSAGCYPAAIELFASGKLNGVAEGVVTHCVPLGQGETAFRLAANQGSREERKKFTAGAASTASAASATPVDATDRVDGHTEKNDVVVKVVVVP